MPLRSMTGFARSAGEADGASWQWELRSVNGRGLELRLRLPTGFEALEQPSRAAIQSGFARGNLQATLNVRRDGGGARLVLNESALADAHAAARRATEIVGGAPVALDSLLQMRGVIETAEIAPDDWVETAGPSIMTGLGEAVAALQAMRAEEGARLAAVLEAQIDRIGALAGAIRVSPARGADAVRARLAAQVATLIEASNALSDERLHQEAALIAARADVEEELDRLDSHIAATRALLAESEPVGRKLEFLAQEFNREANTICSKANDIEITRAGLDLKAVIDQLREQVQNIE
jgi:uncharacterized protein (TIGR00255 family)